MTNSLFIVINKKEHDLLVDKSETSQVPSAKIGTKTKEQ